MDESSRQPRQVDGGGAQSGEGCTVCAHGGDMSSRRWQQSWPRTNTTVPHGDRGRPGQGRGAREEIHGSAPEDAPPQAAGVQYFAMDTGEDVEEAPAAGRPAPLLEVRPQEGLRRHTGVGFELVLDLVVPQLGRELVEVPTVVSQPEFQQHSAEQNVDIPARGGVGHSGDRPARVLTDLAHLEQVRRRTAMEVMRWFVDLARGFTLTSEERYSVVRLMPDYRRKTTASPGRKINTGRRAGADSGG